MHEAGGPQQAKRAGRMAQGVRLVRGGLRGVLGAASAAVVVSIGASLYQSYQALQEYVRLPSEFYLELDLESQTLVERSNPNPLALLAGGVQQLELRKALQALQAAKDDSRVKGVMALLGGRDSFGGGTALLQELRSALLDFRAGAGGRAPVLAYSNAFGEGGSNGSYAYYLASAADQVYMPHTSLLSLLGFAATQVFFRRALDKLGVQPQVFRREEFKSALTPATNDSYDAASRENVGSLLGDLSEQMAEAVARERRLDLRHVKASMDEAPFTGEAALKLGLLDGLEYRDQVEARLAARCGTRAGDGGGSGGGGSGSGSDGRSALVSPRSSRLQGPRVELQRYLDAKAYERSGLLGMAMGAAGGGALAAGPQPAAGAPTLPAPSGGAAGVAALAAATNKPTVVIVHANGSIVQSAPPAGPAGGASFVESHRLVRLLRRLREDDTVKAVVLRVSSPGGSATASDMIARELALLRKAGKPVVASMGDVAASGGYYISVVANRILAQPGTITGSIGVITALFNVSRFAESLGVTSDTVRISANADWANSFRELSPEQAARVDTLVEGTYKDFIDVVASGRGMSHQAVRAVAKGRVWTGRQAQQVGLVDELGGLSRAVAVAKELAGLPADEDKVQLLEWPPRKVPPIVAVLRATGMLPRGPDGDEPAPLAAAPLADPAAAAARGGALLLLHLLAAPDVGRQPGGAVAQGLHGGLVEVSALLGAAGSGQLPGLLGQPLAGFLGLMQLQLSSPQPGPLLYSLEAEALACSC